MVRSDFDIEIERENLHELSVKFKLLQQAFVADMANDDGHGDAFRLAEEYERPSKKRKFTSPIGSVPGDVVLEIFGWVLTDVMTEYYCEDGTQALIDRRRALVFMSGVCQSWRTLMLDTSTMWTTIDLSHPDFGKACLGRCKLHTSIHVRGALGPGDALETKATWGAALQSHIPQISSIDMTAGDHNGISLFFDLLSDLSPSTSLENLVDLRLESDSGRLAPLVDTSLHFPCLQAMELHNVYFVVRQGRTRSPLPSLKSLAVAFNKITTFGLGSLMLSIHHAPTLEALHIDCTEAPVRFAHHIVPRLQEDKRFLRLDLPNLQTLTMVNVKADVASALCDILRSPTVSRSSFSCSDPSSLVELVSFNDPLCDLLQCFHQCKCSYALFHEEKTPLEPATIQMIALDPSACACPDLKAVLEYPPQHLGSFIPFLSETNLNPHSPVTHRVKDITLSLQAFSIRNRPLGFQNDWVKFFRLFPQLQCFTVYNVDVTKELILPLTNALVESSRILPHLRRLSVTFTPCRADPSDLPRMREAYCGSWMRVAGTLNTIQDVSLVGVPRFLLEDDLWRRQHGHLQTYLAARRSEIEEA